ncbi:MAG: histidine kinase dimerization/phosphoacceptor domain -containing protein [Pseudomonadota bacterium]
MKIKNKLRINAAVSLLIAFGIAVVLFLSIDRLYKANESTIIGSEIITSAFERVSLRNDYIRNNSGRAKDQWFAKNEQIGNLLRSAPQYFQGSEERNLIGGMIVNQESYGEIFSAIVANRERSGMNPGLAAILLEAEERLVNQLDMRAYVIAIQGRALIESSRKTRASALRLAGGSLLFGFLALFVAGVINLGSLRRIITDRIKCLRDGAAVIGAGDLDHRIQITGDDEFVELSEAFNAMSAKLSALYHDLKVEIEDRKLAEAALRQSREDLDRAQEVGQIGSWRLDIRKNVLTWSDENYRIFGVEIGTPLTYESFMGAVHPDDRQYVDTQWQAGLRGEPYDIEHRLVVGGQVKWVREKAYLELDGAGIVLGGFGITQDLTQQKQAEEQIRASLMEKEAMLREIHHRVKNNLQVISSLVSLQADTLTDDRIREEFNTVCDRIRSMAMIHEKLYQTENLARLNFAEYAASLLQYLWNVYDVLAEKVRLNLELSPVALSIEKAIPCGLILNELASNVLKHAFPHNSGGEVTVGLDYDTITGTAHLRVSDNGVGLPAGQDWRQSISLGLRLVEILAGQLCGTVETGTGPGTEFRITFSLKEPQS